MRLSPIFLDSAMPTYDYVCQKCEKEFEVFQSMNDERLTDCPEEDCDGSVKRKIGTGAGIIFKGSGFYETDYRSDSYKAGAKKDSDGGSSGKSDSKSDSKSSGGDSSKTTSSESKSKSSSSAKAGASSGDK